MIDAAVGASAHRVIAVTPWFGYSRQDKKSAPREPISRAARRPHARGRRRRPRPDDGPPRRPGPGLLQHPVDHMTALMMLTQYFNDLGLQDLVVVAPDAGRVKLNKKFASKIGAELAILDKERPAQQVAEIGYVIGDVKGKTAVIVDDMIDTAGHAARRRRRPSSTRAPRASTPPRPTPCSRGNAYENLAASPFEQIVVTDTIPLRRRRAGQPLRAVLRRPADRLDPPDLHRRLRQRGLRRREPAVLSVDRRRSIGPRLLGSTRRLPGRLTRTSCSGRALGLTLDLSVLTRVLRRAGSSTTSLAAADPARRSTEQALRRASLPARQGAARPLGCQGLARARPPRPPARPPARAASSAQR